jgi:hypothetical protein
VVGWPEHWAKAAEPGERREDRASIRPEPPIAARPHLEQPPRKAKLLQRLVGFVGARRDA